jgi:CheY-like chemotaxis protein
VARLLLVEDHAALAEATAEFLQNAGLEVRIAGSGEQALKTAAVFHPDIILCDLRLPDMSGIELARALRATASAKNALIVLHSAISDVDLRTLKNQSNVGIDSFISKPLTEEKLKTLLDGLHS